MGLDTNDQKTEFETEVTEIMYRIEGISHFCIENLFTFE